MPMACPHSLCRCRCNCVLCAGEHNLLDDEAVIVGGTNHSHATKDL